MYPFLSYFCIWHLPRLLFNRLNMHAKVQILFLNGGEKWGKSEQKDEKKWFYLNVSSLEE